MENNDVSKYLGLLGDRKTVFEQGVDLERGVDTESFKFKAIIYDPYAVHERLELPNTLAKSLLDKTEDRLMREYEKAGGNDEDHKNRIGQILSDARDGLAFVGNESGGSNISNKHALGLEAIVIANGTRPSIKIDDLEDDKEIELGEWKSSFNNFKDTILEVSKSVGRIDKANRHCGTGFVVAPNLIMTNRHVLEAIATETKPGSWEFSKNITIDFGGKEFEVLPQVIYTSNTPINNTVNFSNTDMAILKCRAREDEFPRPLKFKGSESELMRGRYTYVIGYPGQPQPRYEDYNILKKLFNYEFGVKRISPGKVDTPIGELEADIHGTVFQHDCTTLGGNSGSAVIDFDETGQSVFGLHFAGKKRTGNYAHAVLAYRSVLNKFGLTFE